MLYVMNKSIRSICSLWLASLALLLVASAARAAGDVTNQTKSLTLRECIDRALEDNLEIKSQRINPSIGTWGVIGAQGIYDPLLAAGINYQRSVNPELSNNTAVSFTDRRVDSSGTLSGLLPSGAVYDFSTATTRDPGFNTNPTNLFNFLYTGNSSVSLTQPLLKNFGLGVNSANIRIARENQSVALQNFVQFVMSKISDVSTAYYELIFAIGNHNSAIEARTVAQQLLDENRKREEVGTMSPLDVIQAESGVAQSELTVITTERAIEDNQNALKRLICQQIREFRGVTLVPVDYPLVQMVAMDVDLSTATALQMRADYLQFEACFGKTEYLRAIYPQPALAGNRCAGQCRIKWRRSEFRWLCRQLYWR